MRNRFGRVTLLALVLVLMAATAAMAAGEVDQTGPAEQQINANVLAGNSFGIWVDAGNGEGGIWFNAEVAGPSNQQEFQMNLLNTTIYGWTIDATGTDLRAYEGADGCDDQGWNCTSYTEPDPAVIIPASNLHVWGGNDGTGQVTAFDGPLPLNPMNTGTASANGSFGLGNPNPMIQLTVPNDANLGGRQYYGTVTYTMTLDIP